MRLFAQKMRLIWLLLIAVHPGIATSGESIATEQIDFQVYLSLLSLPPVAIAAAQLKLISAPSPINGELAYQAILSGSTENYPQVSAFYSKKLTYQSWFTLDLQRSLIAEEDRYNSERKRELIFFDWEAGSIERYKLKQNRKNSPEASEFLQQHYSGLQHKDTVPLTDVTSVLDRLGLLYHLRRSNLTPGKALQLQASDGEDIQLVQVKVKPEEQLVLANGQRYPALELYLTAHDRQDGEPHRPTRIWLSADHRRLPLRIERKMRYGTVIIELQAYHPVSKLSLNGQVNSTQSENESQ